MFLGTSSNAKQCKILNPEVINFSTKKGQLFADADDFLIIDNNALGYRLHYLLNGFSYTHADGTVIYHGECSFEELKGTDQKIKAWAKKRLDTYQGSFMHFLRSVYGNTTLENGFITKPIYGYGTFKFGDTVTQIQDRIVIGENPVSFDSLITASDTNFISLKSRQPLYIVYDPKLAARVNKSKSNMQQSLTIEPKGSVLSLSVNQAIIDKKGSYKNYHDFLVKGYWARQRVGDELPVDYVPPVQPVLRKIIQINPLLTSLQKWIDSIPQEKAYLHFDKPYYATGDTIWFKGYLTTGSRHQLSALSSSICIDLINGQSQPIKTLKLPVDSGTVAGDFILGDDIKAGNYHIRAYTQWMRNAGEDYFFDHTFTVGNPNAGQSSQQKPDMQQTDVQFFPESGKLVNDVTSRVGFKAVGTDGLGANISGTITDNEHNQLAQFSALHAGMGSFLLRPSPGKTYTANIKFGDGSTKVMQLPASLNEGYVLSIYQPSKDSLLVRILASAGLQKSSVKLIAHSSGEVVYTEQININGPITSIWLDKTSFPSGITQFTIFDGKDQPLNERIAFIKNNDRMHLEVKTKKPVYTTKEHLLLELKSEDGKGSPVGANFSVAVIDEHKVPVEESDESTIFSNLLLKSDLKGYIEKPNYYFMTDTGEVDKALDNLMLTQGYRRFVWQKLDSLTNAKPLFKAESLGITISGAVTDLQQRALPNANILLVSTTARINKTTTTDVNGRFKFDNLVFADSAKFAVQARTKGNSRNAMITLDSIPRSNFRTKENYADILIIKDNLQKAEQAGTPAKLTGTHILNQVEIKATQQKKEDKKIVMQGTARLPDEQSADHIYTIPDPEHYIDIKMFIQARIAGMHVEMDESGNEKLVSNRSPDNLSSNVKQAAGNEIQIALNGRPTTLGSLVNGGLQLEDVAKIEVVTNNQAMMNLLRSGNTPVGGYLLILTYPPSARKRYDPNIANVTFKGYDEVRQFYSPRYERPDNAAKVSDNRTTIYWNPYVNTDNTGKATLDFYNADGPGNYRVVVEGIDAAGELGRQVYHYKVE